MCGILWLPLLDCCYQNLFWEGLIGEGLTGEYRGTVNQELIVINGMSQTFERSCFLIEF